MNQTEIVEKLQHMIDVLKPYHGQINDGRSATIITNTIARMKFFSSSNNVTNLNNLKMIIRLNSIFFEMHGDLSIYATVTQHFNNHRTTFNTFNTKDGDYDNNHSVFGNIEYDDYINENSNFSNKIIAILNVNFREKIFYSRIIINFIKKTIHIDLIKNKTGINKIFIYTLLYINYLMSYLLDNNVEELLKYTIDLMADSKQGNKGNKSKLYDYYESFGFQAVNEEILYRRINGTNNSQYIQYYMNYSKVLRNLYRKFINPSIIKNIRFSSNVSIPRENNMIKAANLKALTNNIIPSRGRSRTRYINS